MFPFSNILFNIQSSFLVILNIHLNIHSNSGYSNRIFMNIFYNIHFNFSSSWDIHFNSEILKKDIQKDIHQISSGYPEYSREYSFLFVNISNWKRIYFQIWIFCFWIFQTPLIDRGRAAAPIASPCCPSVTFPGS